MNAQTKFIVWDWNGTLFDDTHLVLQSTNVILQQAGHAPLTMEKFREAQARPLEQFYRNIGFTEEDIAPALEADHGSFHDIYERLAETAALRAGAEEMLSHARDNELPSFILSNHLVEPICKQLNRLEIRDHFHEVLAYASRATQYRDMTKGERLRRYLKDSELHPRNAIIIGDTIEEIEIARALGLASVAITGGTQPEPRLRAAKPDHVIHSLHDLKPILEERGFVS